MECEIDVAAGALRYSEAAKLLGIGRSTLYELLARGELRKVRIPGVARPRILRSDVEGLLRRGLEGADG